MIADKEVNIKMYIKIYNVEGYTKKLRKKQYQQKRKVYIKTG